MAELPIELPGPWLGADKKKRLEDLAESGCLLNPIRALRGCVDDKEAEGLDQLRALLAALEELEGRAEDSESRKERRLLGDRLYQAYWSTLEGLLQHRLRLSVEAPFEPTMEELALFDFGVVDDRLTACPVGMLGEFYCEPQPIDGFRYGRFSDYIGEEWALTGKGSFPSPKGGADLAEQIKLLQCELQSKRRQRRFLLNLLAKLGAERSVADIGEPLTFAEEHLLDRIELRRRTYRVRFAEAREEARLDEIRRRWDECHGAWLSALDRWEGSAIEDIVKLVRSLRETDADEERTAELLVHLCEEARRRDARRARLRDKHPFEDPMARRLFLGDSLRRKKEFLGMAAKRSRMERTAFFRGPRERVRWSEISSSLATLLLNDQGLTETLRVRIHGLPRVFVFPGMGNAVYDWEDHSLIVPLYPPKGVKVSLSWGMALFRWDADEDRELKDGYGLLKLNKGKSISALQESFCEDYQTWMTREIAGYRVLPGEVFRWFKQRFKKEETKEKSGEGEGEE